MATTESDLSSHSSKLVEGTTKFAFHLYKQLASSNPDGNVFVSPISISVALAMAFLGAEGNTKAQMKKVLELDDMDDKSLHKCFAGLIASLKNTEDNYVLHMANRLYGDRSHKFLKEYTNRSKKYYGADLAAVDFM